MLLTDDDFASIEAAVEEGSRLYRNLRKDPGLWLPVNGGARSPILLAAFARVELRSTPCRCSAHIGQLA